MSSSHLVHVIVPFYNVERYLDECISSCLNQTHDNINLVLVNDGSTDSSPTVARGYLHDNRVTILHKENGGSSSSRNAGLDFIFNNPNKDVLSIEKGGLGGSPRNGGPQGRTGYMDVQEYVVFLDSDDYMSIDTVEALLNKIVEHDCDIADGLYVQFIQEDEGVMSSPSTYKIVANNEVKSSMLRKTAYTYASLISTSNPQCQVELSEEGDFESIKMGSRYFLSQIRDANLYAEAPGCGMLLKKEILRDVRYINFITNEDCPFSFEVMMKDDIQVCFCSVVSCYKRIREGSVSHHESFGKVGNEYLINTFRVISMYLLEKLKREKDAGIKRLLECAIRYNVNGMCIYKILAKDSDNSCLFTFLKYTKVRHIVYAVSPSAYRFVKTICRTGKKESKTHTDRQQRSAGQAKGSAEDPRPPRAL